MASFNKVILLGNLARDPELIFTSSGQAIAKFTLAVNRRYMQNGREMNETCFVDITVWGKQAENCKQYLVKGSAALIEGRLIQETWEDRNGGGKRSKIAICAEKVQFVNSRDNSQQQPQQTQNQGGYNQSASAYPPETMPMPEDNDDICPF